MTAKGNTVLTNLASILTAAGFALVTTRKLGWRELTEAQFPAVVIDAGSESFADFLQNKIESTWQVTLRLHVVKSLTEAASVVWREKAALIGRTIAANRTLSGAAIKAEVTGRQPDNQVYEPWASGTLGLTIRYRYNDLTEGG
ncbi:MAG: hypothetical protein AB1403_00720 [Candidatus Riflebacteria bacterium]